ncbi:MAG: hypothetical protein ABFS19_12420 [Thermodesulfobacteriota bacterium]
MNQLGVVTNIVESVGMGVSYAYEDLVFLEHNSFLLQFTDNDREILVHVNSEADKEAVDLDIERLQEIGLDHEMQFAKGDEYTLSQVDDETVTIEFSGS